MICSAVTVMAPCGRFRLERLRRLDHRGDQIGAAQGEGVILVGADPEGVAVASEQRFHALGDESHICPAVPLLQETGRSCMTKSKPRSRMFSLSRRSDGEDGTWPATV